jgi:hypothetical protein
MSRCRAVLLPLFGQSAVSNRKTNSHDDENDLHGTDQDVDDPRAPADDADAHDHVDPEDPGVLSPERISMCL